MTGLLGTRRPPETTTDSQGRSVRLVGAPVGSRSLGAQLVDVVVLALAVLLALVPLVPVFGLGAAAPAVVGGVVVGAVLAVAALVRRWPVVVTLAATFLAYVLLGGPLAAPSTTTAGVLPTGRTLVTLGQGVVTSWKQVLTLEPPIGTSGTALVAPFVLGLGAVLGGGLLAATRASTGRAASLRLLGAVVVPPAVLVLAILLGTVQRTLAVVVGATVTVLVVVWVAWRRGGWRPQRVPSLAVLALLSVGGGVLLAPVVASDTPRFVLRSVIVPPFDPRDHASPLSAYRAFIKDQRETDLLTVDGLPEDGLVRLATMDSFDGVVWNVVGDGEPQASGAFRKVGDTIPVSTSAATVWQDATVEVQVDALGGPWLPTVGETRSVTFSGPDADRDREAFRFNDATGTGVLSTSLVPGQRYTLDAVVPGPVTDEEIGSARASSLALPAPQQVPDVVVERAKQVTANASSPAGAARAIETYLHDTGYFSHGDDYPSLAGHSAYRMNLLLGDDLMVGDAEQYASVMALMATQSGLTARVVLGFVPTEEQRGDDSITFQGGEIQAWTEIAYEGVGWVPYFPTPETNRTPETADEEVQNEPQPQVVQPPPPPAEPVAPPSDDAEDPSVTTNEEDTEAAGDLRAVLVVVAVVAVPLLLLLVPVLVVLALKARRRRRRRRAPTAEQQISGGWDEVLDTAHDFRVPPPTDATRREASRALLETFPKAPVALLAEQADAAVFSADGAGTRGVSRYWASVDETVRAIRGHGSTWARLRGSVSLTSLRRRRGERSRARARERATGRDDRRARAPRAARRGARRS
ncbi:Na+-driven multidrug efflux pump [Sanguibacter keddieii DSM 10542]|uniref:Na+-driven multidrug efflux pump n=1 Tax=Sanguibacter keddieii (strain ATCC 51767 / DSM 10542 / NCFB 3025 / ST-74) TaxID=446469 RepID=D1BAH4_SANKS|nr:Na+-driven multidrug efflux pump [Sanguibacter keddieii DSM 10542]